MRESRRVSDPFHVRRRDITIGKAGDPLWAQSIFLSLDTYSPPGALPLPLLLSAASAICSSILIPAFCDYNGVVSLQLWVLTSNSRLPVSTSTLYSTVIGASPTKIPYPASPRHR